MNHASIITRLYANFSSYWGEWRKKFDETGESGALVFLPDKKMEWEWWSIPEIRDYIQEGGLDDREMLDGLEESRTAGEFLVLVIEYVDGPRKQKAHFHRMSKVQMN
jgi:hypothetical protein